jgi:hypothetical protein
MTVEDVAVGASIFRLLSTQSGDLRRPKNKDNDRCIIDGITAGKTKPR